MTIINFRPHGNPTTGRAIHPHKKRYDRSKTHPQSFTDRRHAQPAPNTHPASPHKQQKGKPPHRPPSRLYQRAHRPAQPSTHQPPHTSRRLARKPYAPSHTPARTPHRSNPTTTKSTPTTHTNHGKTLQNSPKQSQPPSKEYKRHYIKKTKTEKTS